MLLSLSLLLARQKNVLNQFIFFISFQAWFREMPSGVLDSIPPEQVMQCQSEEDCARVAKRLPPAEAALLDWAVNLMADVVQEEHINKMNDRNIAMVFAPNMTQVLYCGNIIANKQYIPDSYTC
jgi:hypothetical protein